MNEKLTANDRKRIHAMIDDGMTHAEIARALRVCVKTIDREAVRWRARTVTVRTEALDGWRPIVSSVTVGSEVRGEDLEAVVEEARRIAAELEGMSFEIPEAEMIAAAEEAERMAREAEADMTERRRATP